MTTKTARKTRLRIELDPFEQSGRHWRFYQPTLSKKHQDRLDAIAASYNEIGIEDDMSEVVDDLCDIVAAHPDCLKAYNLLALILEACGEHDEAFRLWLEAERVITYAKPLMLKIRAQVGALISFYVGDNQPYFHCLYGLASAYLNRPTKLGITELLNIQAARLLLEELLWVNPSDHIGACELLIKCLFELAEYKHILTVCEQFQCNSWSYAEGEFNGETDPDLESVDPNILYGQALAAFYLKRDDATLRLKLAIKRAPLCGEILLAKKLKKDPSKGSSVCPLDGAYEALTFWNRYASHWQRCPQAMKQLRAMKPAIEAAKATYRTDWEFLSESRPYPATYSLQESGIL